tara:strand:+ start:5453 stop:5917 length:465 start_codon:yes stop_codon:yes gene_type:complete
MLALKMSFKNIFLYIGIIIFSIFVTPAANAGEIMQSGTVLEQDSYVFTIEEANALLNRVEELEQKELLLNEYIALNTIQSRQIDLYKVNYDLIDQQRLQYTQLITLNEDLLARSRRQNQFRELKDWGLFSLGVAVTIGAFLAADRIGDTMETTY